MIFRFVPLKGSDDTYRIILKDRRGGCDRFLSASPDCSVMDVGFTKNDYREGLQRWVMTKVAGPDSSYPSPTDGPTPTLSPLPTQSPVPPPTITASYGTSFSSANVTVASPDASVTECTVTLTPGGISSTVSMPAFPGMATASFTQLSAVTIYAATASCRLADGSFTPSSDPVELKTYGGSYNRPPGANTRCDGRGEVINDVGQCVCDPYNIIDGPFKANDEGGCECFDDAEDLGYGPCVCPFSTERCFEGCCATCSPWNFSLSASNGLTEGSNFGGDVALNAAGDVMVVGDNDANYNDINYAGLAYVYRFNGSEWAEEEILSAGAEAAEFATEFGISIAINAAGDLIAIGDEDGNATAFDDRFGKVLLFEKTISGWGVADVLTPSLKGLNGFFFGRRVAINAHGNVSVIGDWGAYYSSLPGAGRVYVYVYDGSEWNLAQTLDAGADVDYNDKFGVSVAINGVGDVIAVCDDSGYVSRKFYIFRFDGTSWVSSEKVTSSSPIPLGRYFPLSIALDNSGGVLVLGAGNAYAHGEYAGAAYVFRYNGSDWNEEATLDAGADNVGNEFSFGISVAISGNGEVIAVADDENIRGPGAVYVFRYSDSSWNKEARVNASASAPIVANDRYDVALNHNGTVLVVGHPNPEMQQAFASFRYDGSDWFEEDILSIGEEDAPVGPVSPDLVSVAVNAVGDVIAIENHNTAVDDYGKVFMFRYNDTSETWYFSEYFNISNTFGYIIALDASGNVLLVGDPDADVYSNVDDRSGKAYVFRYDSDSSNFVEETVFIPPKDKLVAKSFGFSVSMNGDGDVILVGDPFSDDITDAGPGNGAGVAYVFMRGKTKWIEHILSAGNDVIEDAFFGFSTALNGAGDVAAIGAIMKDFDEDYDENEYAGRVYMFQYDGSTWSLTDILTASDSENSLDFGHSVALNAAGNVLVVGDDDADHNGLGFAGQAYVFRYNGSNWVEEQILSSGDDARYNDNFGFSVAINAAGDVIAVGDHDADAASEDDEAGKVYIFKHNGSSWNQDRVFVHPDASSDFDRGYYDYLPFEFGTSVAMDESGDIVAVGDTDAYVDVSEEDNHGRVYVFRVCRYENDTA